jgi:hypothetical protein
MTKVDKYITNAFRRIHKAHEKNNIDVMQMICMLGNTMLNIQQMFVWQATHIVLVLPLNSISRECIFINTYPVDQRTFVVKPSFLLKQKLDDLEDVMCHSSIDYYIEQPHAIKNIFLAEFVSKYKKDETHISKRKKPNVIRFIKYSKYIHYEFFGREKLLLYVLFKKSEYALKHN